MCWQSKRFYWERAPGWKAVGKGTQENCSAAWLAVLGFMVMGLVSGWSLANHFNSESFLVVHASLSQDGCYREGFWEVDGQVVFPLDLFRTLPAGGGLLLPYSLSGSPAIKQLMQMVTMVPGQGGQVSISVLPLTLLFLLKDCSLSIQWWFNETARKWNMWTKNTPSSMPILVDMKETHCTNYIQNSNGTKQI